jgi:hypothetical protein
MQRDAPREHGPTMATREKVEKLSQPGLTLPFPPKPSSGVSAVSDNNAPFAGTSCRRRTRTPGTRIMIGDTKGSEGSENLSGMERSSQFGRKS